MADYQAMYLKLASTQADAIDSLRETTDKLVRAHRDAEEMLLSVPETPIQLVAPEDQD